MDSKLIGDRIKCFDPITNQLELKTGQNETKILNHTQFVPIDNQTFYICTPTFDDPQLLSTSQPITGFLYDWQKPLNEAEYYISIVLVVISIIFELIFILTIALFRERRNKGSINVLCMVCIILTVDVTYLLAVTLGEHYSSACEVLGILLHLGLVLIGLWATSLALDIVSTFLRKRKSRGSRFEGKIFLVRLLACFLIAIALVGTCVALNERNIIDFKYGIDNICWIGGYYPRLYFYLIPTIVFFVIGVASLSSVLCHLYRQEKEQRESLKDSGRTNVDLVAISIKLLVLLGLAEVLGLIQIFKTNLTEDEIIVNSTFGFLYTIVRSIRGTLVFWLYLGNKKTWSLYKKTIKDSQHSDSDGPYKLTQLTRLAGGNSATSSPALSSFGRD